MLLQLSWRHLVKKIRNGLYQSRALLSRTVDVLRMCILNFWEIYFTISAIKTYSRDTRFHLDLAHVCSVRVPWPCLAHAYFERVCIFSLFLPRKLTPATFSFVWSRTLWLPWPCVFVSWTRKKSTLSISATQTFTRDTWFHWISCAKVT